MHSLMPSPTPYYHMGPAQISLRPLTVTTSEMYSHMHASEGPNDHTRLSCARPLYHGSLCMTPLDLFAIWPGRSLAFQHLIVNALICPLTKGFVEARLLK